MSDWDGLGMRSTESQTVRFDRAVPDAVMGFPNFIDVVKPLQYWFCLFAAIPLGCASAILDALATPPPQSPALRLRFIDARMRIEAMRAYLLETASRWRPGAPVEYQALVLRTKTYVTQEATKICAELFALGGGRHYRRSGALARACRFVCRHGPSASPTARARHADRAVGTVIRRRETRVQCMRSRNA